MRFPGPLFDGTGDHLLSNYFPSTTTLLYATVLLYGSAPCPTRPPPPFGFSLYSVSLLPCFSLPSSFVSSFSPVSLSSFHFFASHIQDSLSLRSVHPKQCALLNCLFLFVLTLVVPFALSSHIDTLRSLVFSEYIIIPFPLIIRLKVLSYPQLQLKFVKFESCLASRAQAPYRHISSTLSPGDSPMNVRALRPGPSPFRPVRGMYSNECSRT